MDVVHCTRLQREPSCYHYLQATPTIPLVVPSVYLWLKAYQILPFKMADRVIAKRHGTWFILQCYQSYVSIASETGEILPSVHGD